MQNTRHREAFTIFTAQPTKLRSEFVVNCILESQVEIRMQRTIREVISVALKDATFMTAVPQQAAGSIQATEDVSDLPDALLSSLEEI